MRTFPRIALAIILSVVFLVQALGEKINANPSSSSYNQNATDQGATILSVEIGEKEEEIGYIYSKALNEGPEDFLIDEEGNILILDSCNKKILHYQNQVFIESISIDHCSLPSRILKINNHLYVLDYYSIWVYDLSKQTWSQAELPSVVEHFSVYVYDIINDHDSLVLITELYGNYLLNEKSNSFDLTNRGYSSYRDGDHVIIERGDTKWTIHDETSSFRVIDFDDDTYSVFEENNTSETGRVMIQQRDKSTLQAQGYICKRPASWSACSHSSKSYNYNANYHWKVCNLCGQKVTVDVAHTTIPYGGGYKCTVCGAVLPGVRSFSSPIHDEKTAINNAVLYVPSKHDCMAVIRFRRED